jgi:hypothetical protein
MLYFAFVTSKLEYASVAWNSVTITDFNKLGAYKEHLQPFATLHFFKLWNITVIIYWKN